MSPAGGMVSGNGGTEVVQPRVGAVAVIRRGRKVLLGRRLKRDGAYGVWVFPGGGIDDDELDEAVRRECAEEVGLDVVVGSVISVTRSEHSGRKNVAIVCWATQADPNEEPSATAEIGEPAYFAVEEALRLPLMPVTAEVLERIAPQLDDDGDSVGVRLPVADWCLVVAILDRAGRARAGTGTTPARFADAIAEQLPEGSVTVLGADVGGCGPTASSGSRGDL